MPLGNSQGGRTEADGWCSGGRRRFSPRKEHNLPRLHPWILFYLVPKEALLAENAGRSQSSYLETLILICASLISPSDRTASERPRVPLFVGRDLQHGEECVPAQNASYALPPS
jgi:hypothetical protein